MTVGEYNLCVDQYADGIYRFILKHLRVEDKASDVVQDTYLKMWNKVGEVSYEKAKSYLFTTAYRTMIDMLRSEKMHQNYVQSGYGESVVEQSYPDVQSILKAAIDLLPVEQKAVILLRDYEGYSYDEIAEITALSESQVKVYIFRGRSFLKRYIGKIENLI